MAAPPHEPPRRRRLEHEPGQQRGDAAGRPLQIAAAGQCEHGDDDANPCGGTGRQRPGAALEQGDAVHVGADRDGEGEEAEQAERPVATSRDLRG